MFRRAVLGAVCFPTAAVVIKEPHHYYFMPLWKIAIFFWKVSSVSPPWLVDAGKHLIKLFFNLFLYSGALNSGALYHIAKPIHLDFWRSVNYFKFQCSLSPFPPVASVPFEQVLYFNCLIPSTGFFPPNLHCTLQYASVLLMNSTQECPLSTPLVQFLCVEGSNRRQPVQ